MAASRRQRSNWIGELQTPSLLKRPTVNSERGARRLFDMAKGSVARNMGGLTAEHFSDVPWPVAERVWQEMIEMYVCNRLSYPIQLQFPLTPANSRSTSFHAWRVFAFSYSTHFTSAPSHRYRIELKQPPLPLPDYYAGLTSPTSAWLTALRIAPKRASASDLVRLASLPNLAVLDLSDGPLPLLGDADDSHFDERILRAWKEVGTCFPRLRVLMLGWQGGVDRWIFPYLSIFPNLEVFVVTDCAKLHQKNRSYWEAAAGECGWTARHAKKSAKSLKPVLDDQTFYRGAVGGMLRNDGEREKKPVMEAWLGSPRPWTHVVDDFPGLRTVWFDRVGAEDNSSKKLTVGTAKTQEGRKEAVKDRILQDVKTRPKKAPAPSGEEDEPTKRPRDVLTPTSEATFSSPPPAKRNAQHHQKRTAKIQHRSAAELLAEFGH